MTKVSIIIPVYKVEKFIGRCIDSVVGQTYTDGVECIIVDDKTPDHSMEVIKEMINGYTGSLDFRILHHEQNKGLSETRNTGIREAKGEYLYFLDSDDAITKDCVGKLLYLAEKYHPDFVIGDTLVIEEKKNKTSNSLGTGNYEYLEGNENIGRAYVNSGWYSMGCNKLVAKKFLLEHQLLFCPGIYHEDELWSYTLASLADKMAICRGTTYLYYKREGSIMGTFSQKHLEDLLFVIRQMSEVLRKRPNKYLPVKIRNVSLFFVFRLLDSEYDRDFRLQVIRRLNLVIGRKIRYTFPLNLKDAVRGLTFVLPVKLALAYAGILKKIIS